MNCFFEDLDLETNVIPLAFIQEDQYGYFIPVQIEESFVVDAMKIGLRPIYIPEDDIFSMNIRVNNRTDVCLNGITVEFFGDKRLKKLPASRLIFNKIAVRKYSQKTKPYSHMCYATKVVARVEIN